MWLVKSCTYIYCSILQGTSHEYTSHISGSHKNDGAVVEQDSPLLLLDESLVDATLVGDRLYFATVNEQPNFASIQ